MIALRHLPRPLRRARLLAARKHPGRIGGVVWRGILHGGWDGGAVVQRFMQEAG